MTKSEGGISRKQILTVNKRRFQLLKKLGEGGTGSVWFAKNLESSRGSSYALKVMYLDVNEMTTQSAKREIENQSKLSHPSIIKLLDAERKSEVNGHPAAVLVMECAPRGDLFEYIRINRGLRKKTDSSAVHRIFVDMVHALEHMHSLGICHRDIKPENILFDYNYSPRLADMGFSKVFRQNDSRLKLREQLGSRGYHAPEIVRESYYCENVDIFSLGVVLFIMYAGSPPFRQVKKSDWWYEKLATKQYEKFWNAHERGMKFSSALKRLLEGMLAVNPRQRLSLQGVKNSVWFKKTTRMNDKQYRSYMHSIYKKIHPKCKSGTPPAKKVEKVQEPIPEMQASIGGGDTRDAPPKTPVPVVKESTSGTSDASEVDSGDSMQDTVETEEPVVSVLPHTASQKILNDIAGPIKVQAGGEDNEEEEVEGKSDDDSESEIYHLKFSEISETKNVSTRKTEELNKEGTIRKALDSIIEDARSMGGSPARSPLPRHNVLEYSDDVAEDEDVELIDPSTPASKTPILSLQDCRHPLAMVDDDSSEEEDEEIARACRMATATITNHRMSSEDGKVAARTSKSSETPRKAKRKSWWNFFS